MQFGRHRTRRARLLARQAEVADKHRLRRVAQIVDLRHAARAPIGRPGDQEGDTGVAFPPAFVRVTKPADNNRHPAWLRRLGDIPNLVRRSAEAA